MVKMIFDIPKSTKEEFRQLAKLKGMGMATLLRTMIIEAVRKHREEIKKASNDGKR